jgi:hypothetical protein
MSEKNVESVSSGNHIYESTNSSDYVYDPPFRDNVDPEIRLDFDSEHDRNVYPQDWEDKPFPKLFG